jgi:putative hydrolase of the HAD superfamily
MTHPQPFRPGDWQGITLVAFDVDGTLYDQRALRLRMARDLLSQAFRRRDLGVFRVLGTYRDLREQLGDAETHDFESQLLARTATTTRSTESTVRTIVAEWIERRPLLYLADCRYKGVTELFAGLRRHRKVVGVISDYPAAAKLAALGLAADFVVSATDSDVAVLKPHPRGLRQLMRRAAVSPSATLLIGDRTERDGLAAQRASTHCLIRSSRPKTGWQTFAHFNDPLFGPMLSQ